MERWVHDSQIRPALGRGPLDDRLFLDAGLTVAAATAGIEREIPRSPEGPWALGPLVLGDRTQAANILTKGLTSAQISSVATDPPDAVGLLASVLRWEKLIRANALLT